VRSPRAYSLTEAVIASFVLITALIVVSRLFHSSLRYSSWVESKAVATYLAENRMAELQRWARDSTDWTSPPSGNEPGFSKYAIQVTIESVELASPSLELESLHAGDQRIMSETARKARVEVSWGGNNSVQLVGLLRAPVIGWRASNPIVITGSIPSPVTSSSEVNLQARGYDSSGAEIQDLFFTWSVEPVFPGAATGTLTPSRSGRTCSFHNQLPSVSGPVPSSGNCRITATAIYGGEERRGSSPVLTLSL